MRSSMFICPVRETRDRTIQAQLWHILEGEESNPRCVQTPQMNLLAAALFYTFARAVGR